MDALVQDLRCALRCARSRRHCDEVVRNTLIRERMMAALAIPFGLLAAVLTAVGLYGVFSDAMARRTREIGIRIALGATRRDIIGPFLHETALVLLIGLVPGLLVTFGASRAAASLLFGVTPYDATIPVAAAASLASIAGVATYIPARRAARVDPIDALRTE